MSKAVGLWLSDLILAHLDTLASEAVAIAQAQVPWYSTLPAPAVQAVFVTTYQMLAATCAADDVLPMQTYVERVIMDRINNGAPAEGLIALATLLEGTIHRLINREGSADPLRAAHASRRLMDYTKSLRLLMSGINLRLLMQTQGRLYP
ncbi:MAG: hypothetical protein M3Z04_21510 [Chloroflexota bacterium]|nr:hypothetical protein [Chloroflexota bacterium]